MTFIISLLVLTVINLLTTGNDGFSLTSMFSSGIQKVYSGTQSLKCTFMECCTDEYITPDINKLDETFTKELYGQNIAHQVIINSLGGHLTTNPPKALSMSFHGPPGTGKTYISQLIAKFLYKEGDQSTFFHFFNGRNDFPLESKVNEYKEELIQIIIRSLEKCERSMFVFDEVDKMPIGLLNVLVPFLDYNRWIKSSRYASNFINTRKAIYIFLSNSGSSSITQRLLTLWEEGKQRQDVKLQDFENLISIGAFNEKGGFHHSDAIVANVIDHYVPFLPLEGLHVRKCLKKAFLNRNVNPTNEMIEEGLSYVVFGPPPHNLYAIAGCKRLEQKVASIIYAKRAERIDL